MALVASSSWPTNGPISSPAASKGLMGIGTFLRPRHINALPMEILTAIFLMLVVEEFAEPKTTYQKFALYPWVLAWVCGGWRKLCLDNKVLWTYITLEGHRCGEGQSLYNPKPYIRLLKQLERTGDRLLTVDATPMCRCTPEVTRFRAIVDEAHRWKVAIFCLGFASPGSVAEAAEFLRDLFPEGIDFPLLRELRWDGEGRRSDSSDLVLPFIGCTLPSLRSLVLTGLGDHRYPGFPWDKLEELTLLDYHGNACDLLDLLRRCPNLGRLSLGVERGTVSSFNHLPTASSNGGARSVRFANLTEISIAGPGGALKDCTLLLPYIEAPRLRTLAISHSISGYTAALRNFLGIFGEGLRNLSLPYFYLPRSDYSEAFGKLLPNLQHLSFRNYETNGREVLCDTFLRVAEIATKEAQGHPEILPHLECLELHDVGFDATLLAHVVKLRTREGIPSPNTSSSESLLDDIRLRSLIISFERISSVKDTQSAEYHAQAAEAKLARYVRDRRLHLEISVANSGSED